MDIIIEILGEMFSVFAFEEDKKGCFPVFMILIIIAVIIFYITYKL